MYLFFLKIPCFLLKAFCLKVNHFFQCSLDTIILYVVFYSSQALFYTIFRRLKDFILSYFSMLTCETKFFSPSATYFSGSATVDRSRRAFGEIGLGFNPNSWLKVTRICVHCPGLSPSGRVRQHPKRVHGSGLPGRLKPFGESIVL